MHQDHCVEDMITGVGCVSFGCVTIESTGGGTTVSMVTVGRRGEAGGRAGDMIGGGCVEAGKQS